MVIPSTRQGNSIFDEMKERAFKLYMMERQKAYETYTEDSELKEALELSEDDYNFNLLKLDVLALLACRVDFIQRPFIRQKVYIEQMDISEKNKVEAILTSACVFEYFGIELTNRAVPEDELYLLAQAMVNVEPKKYLTYQPLVLTNFNKLITLLRNMSNSTFECAKQYVKTENN